MDKKESIMTHEIMHSLGLYHTHLETFEKTVYFNGEDPNKPDLIFSLQNPAQTNDDSLKSNEKNLYIGKNSSKWEYYSSDGKYRKFRIPTNQKYVFYHADYNSVKATDNFMSYNYDIQKTTWKWQWEILKNNIKQ